MKGRVSERKRKGRLRRERRMKEGERDGNRGNWAK